jgi:protein subunit release factor A
MTIVEVVETIGDVLTDIDTSLSAPTLSMEDPQWQQLYALRKHLDELQQELVKKVIQQDDQKFSAFGEKIKDATNSLNETLADFTKLDSAIATIAQIASWADQALKLV